MHQVTCRDKENLPIAHNVVPDVYFHIRKLEKQLEDNGHYINDLERKVRMLQKI